MRLRIWQEGSQFGFDSKSCFYPLTVWITTNCWKIAKEMGIPDDLTCLLQNLYVGQEAAVRTRHGTMNWFQLVGGVWQGYILSPCLFNYYAEYTMRNAELNESQAGIKLLGELPATSDTQMIPLWWQKVKRNLMRVKRGEWRSWLKTQHSKN